MTVDQPRGSDNSRVVIRARQGLTALDMPVAVENVGSIFWHEDGSLHWAGALPELSVTDSSQTVSAVMG